jgi:hypothetical protein
MIRQTILVEVISDDYNTDALPISFEVIGEKVAIQLRKTDRRVLVDKADFISLLKAVSC